MGRERQSEPLAVGSRPARSDGPGKVTGATRFVDDLIVEGVWHGVTVRSPHARARLVAIDTSEAMALGDVVCVTGESLGTRNCIRLLEADWPVLVTLEARQVGEAVCLVAAPTRARALEAAAAVRLEWEELEPVPSIVAESAERVEDDPTRLLANAKIVNGDSEAGLAAADLIVEGTYETGHQEHAYIEPNGIIAIPGEGTLELVGSMQCPYYVQGALSELFDLAPENVRVRQAATGGGFGGKEDYPDMIAAHASLLARACGSPVKIIYDRHEDIIATTKRHPSRVRHRTGVMRDGTLVAMEIDVLLDGGAYATLSPVVLSRAVLHAGGAYRCPNVKIDGRVVASNTATNGAFRGFGAPQVLFAVERHMDLIARRLGLDPWTLREKNAYRVGDATPTGQVLSESVSALECLREAEERTNFKTRWAALEATRRDARDDGAPLEGIGLSLVWHGAGFVGNGERDLRSPVTVDLQRAGVVRIRVSSTDFGQGTEMALAQIVADAVGLDVSNVKVVQPDTAVVPNSGPTVASRTIMVVGRILERAGHALRDRLLEFAAGAGNPAEFELRSGILRSPQGEERFAELADRYLDQHEQLEVTEQFKGDGSDFDEQTYRGTAYSSYGWGCCVVEVEVDPDTLQARPRRSTMIADVGKAIHPTLCAGQVEGGALQALAFGYLEEVKLERGHYQNDRLQTYIIPTSMDVPETDTVLLENPTSHGPFGAKGVGELPMDGGAPAVVAAIENATGISPVSVPATPERLLDDRRAGRIVKGDDR